MALYNVDDVANAVFYICPDCSMALNFVSRHYSAKYLLTYYVVRSKFQRVLYIVSKKGILPFYIPTKTCL